jgi:hypothetical protein
MSNNNKGSVHARQVKTYPPLFYHRLLKGYVIKTGMTESAAARQMIISFFEKMGENERQELLRLSDRKF